MASQDDFVSYIWPHAVAASEATGVDPRIIAGQAAIESGWGNNFVGNNLFGIKGPGINALTTEVGPGGPYRTQANFRAYATPADSVSGYADFINTNPRYSAFRDASDARGQLTALQRSGYATDPNYAGKVANAAAAIDAAVKKRDAATWSNSPGTPTDIKTALGYTGGNPEPNKVASVDDSSDFFKDMGLKSKGTSSATESPGGDFFKDMGLKPAGTKDATEAKKSSSGPVAGDAAAAVGSGIGDLPIIGPYVKEGMIRGAAAIGSVVNPALGLPAPSADQIRQWDAQLRQEHPIAYSAGRTLSAGASLAGAAGAGAGGVLGMAGNMLPRIGYGALSGGAIGAADAYTHGDNPLIGAGLGVAGGAIAPPAGAMIGMGVNKLAQGVQYLMPTGVSGVSRPAANIAATVIGADDPAAVRATMAQLGPQAMLADAGPSTTGLTGGLVLKPGEAKTVVENAISQRASGANARLQGDVEGALGPAPLPSRIQASIEANQGALSPEYNAVLANARAANTQPLADRLDSSVANLRGPAQRAVRDVRGMLNIPGTDQLDPHPGALLATRNAVDGLMANEQNPQVIRQLTMARQDLDRELARAAPGIKDVDARFQELARQSEALDQGGRILDSGKTAIRPHDFAQTFAEGANPAGTLTGPSAVPLRMQQGARAEVDRLLGTKSNDLVALRSMLQGEGGWNTAKMGTVFGEEPTNRLLGSVNREVAFNNTTQEVLRNSATARRQAAGELLKETEPGSMNLLPASTTGLALQAGKKMLFDPLVHLLTASPSAPRNLELARIMTAQGATRDQILQQLLRLNARQQAVSNTGNLLAGITGGTVNPLLAGASVTQRP